MLIPVPNPGDSIYICSTNWMWGGLAEVVSVRIDTTGEKMALLVLVKEAEGLEEYDWNILYPHQADLKLELGSRRARQYGKLAS